MVVDKKQNSGRSEKIENKTSKLLNSSEKMDTNEVEVVKPAEEKLDEGHKKHLRKVTERFLIHQWFYLNELGITI